MKKAKFSQSLKNQYVQCLLCPHRCKIKPGAIGLCHVRKNIDGILYSLSYGHPIAGHVDPIEKKPLFHFLPGSFSYSVATVGCNLCCKHCQNADISQVSLSEVSSKEISAEEIVSLAKQHQCQSISYTYTEPTVFYEYVYDIAPVAHKKNLKNVLVTNGYISKEPLQEIAPFIDAANIDLKSMSEEFYKKVCGAHLKPVLKRIQQYHDLGIWIELTTLLIPGYNDSKEELRKLATFIAEIDPMIPWHISGFHPSYQLQDAPMTTMKSLEMARTIGKACGLQYIYLGNIGIGETTYCPSCGAVLIDRHGFQVTYDNLLNNQCRFCQTELPGVY